MSVDAPLHSLYLTQPIYALHTLFATISRSLAPSR